MISDCGFQIADFSAKGTFYVPKAPARLTSTMEAGGDPPLAEDL